MAKNKTKQVKEVEVSTPVKEVVAPKVEVKEPVMSEVDKEFMDKIMAFLGYNRKKALHYDYFMSSGKPMPNSFKEAEILEVFKR